MKAKHLILVSAAAAGLWAMPTLAGDSKHGAPAASPTTGHGAAVPSVTIAPPKPSKGEASKTPAQDKLLSGAESKPEAKPVAKSAPKAKTASGGEATADQALQWLTEGNARFVAGECTHPNSGTDRVSEVAPGQKPFATILSCADSRIPVERVFDRGIGELFVVRVAGNVAGVSETGTIEYGTGHLNTPLLVVMGHTSCGAVTAAASGADVHGSVAKLLQRIQPAVEDARAQYPELKPDQIVPIAVRSNVWRSIQDLLTSSDEIRGLVSSGKLTVVGAIYDLSSGEVRFLGEHPKQTAFLKGSSEKPSANLPADADAHADADEHAQTPSH